MYSGGGKVFIAEDGRGWIYLEKDWDGGLLPNDLLEQAGVLSTGVELLTPKERAKLGGYYREGEFAVFLVDKNQFPSICKEEKRIFLGSDLNGWYPMEAPSEWEMKRMDQSWQLRLPWKEITEHSPFRFKFVSDDGEWLEPFCEFPSVKQDSNGVFNYLFDQRRTGSDVLVFEMVEEERNSNLKRWIKYRPEGKFGFFRDSNGLGKFRVFAPRAKKVDLLIYQNLDDNQQERYPMESDEDGSWSIQSKGQWENAFYMISITQQKSDSGNALFEKKILDPYARAAVGRNGPGIVLSDSDQIDRNNLFKPDPMKDLVIVEAHVRDLMEKAESLQASEKTSWFERLTNWISSKDCYLRELGVNAVELQPVQEFDSRSREEYHWGYMPVNFFCLESSYARLPQKASGVAEFRSLIRAFHDAGIAVILDVVYNHVGIPAHLMNLDRELYFRIDALGRLQNFSGCGNDLNCEAEPVRKIILDSLKYLVEEFDVDGFRFDLAELLGKDLLLEIEEELREIKPGIILIAEPWSFRGRLPSSMSESNYSLWSDDCRESICRVIKEGNGTEEILRLMSGEMNGGSKPWKSVNYIESHDDYAFIDRIFSFSDSEIQSFPEKVIRKNRLALFLILFSPGIPMLSAGQDFMRNKKGHRNTYQNGELNALKYSDLKKYKTLHLEICRMIEFRRSDEGSFLRPEEKGDCEYLELSGFAENLVVLEVKEKMQSKHHLLVVNPSDEIHSICLPERWIGCECSISGRVVAPDFQMDEYSFLVLNKND